MGRYGDRETPDPWLNPQDPTTNGLPPYQAPPTVDAGVPGSKDGSMPAKPAAPPQAGPWVGQQQQAPMNYNKAGDRETPEPPPTPVQLPSNEGRITTPPNEKVTPTPQTQPNNNVSLHDAIANMYKSALGRDASEGEIASWASQGIGNFAKIQQGIYGSQEAKNYNAKQSGGGDNKPTTSAADFIKQYQSTHPVSEGVQPLYAAMKAAGYNVSPYMYGNTQSNNEITLDGQKYKILGGEGTPGAYWYGAGQNDGGGGASGGIDTGGLNWNYNAIGNDPMSKQIDESLMALMRQGGRLRSSTGDLADAALQKYLKTGGDSKLRMESIREKFGLMQRAQMNDARGELASHNLLSEGSQAQGPEMSTVGRVNANIAPQWAAATRDAAVQDNEQMMQAITMATGLDEQAANRLLSTANTASGRQQMLGDMAIKNLDQNRMWNQFLAEFGLKRDTIMYQLQNDQLGAIQPLIAAFQKWADSQNGGYVK